MKLRNVLFMILGVCFVFLSGYADTPLYTMLKFPHHPMEHNPSGGNMICTRNLSFQMV